MEAEMISLAKMKYKLVGNIYLYIILWILWI